MTRWLIRAAAAALVAAALASAAGGGGIDFRSSFDDGTLGPWTGVQREFDRPAAESFQIVTTPTRSGGGAALFVARQGYSPFDWATGEGTELCCGPQPGETEGDDDWYAWSTLFAAPWTAPYAWGIFAQWHSKFGVPPALDFNIRSTTISVQLHTGAVRLGADAAWAFERSYEILDDVAAGVWHDFVLHVQWSAYARGSVTVWHRVAGDLRYRRVLRVQAVPTLQRLGADVSPVYTLLGIYRGTYCTGQALLDCATTRGRQPDTVVYQDEFRRSTVMFPWCLACRR